MENENKRPVGRPKAEITMPTEWEKIILEAGKKGQHITQFLLELGISWDTHSSLLKRNPKYYEAVQRYNVLCENYWFEQMRDSMEETGGAGYNSRLWSLIMRNKFGERWSEASKVDVTSKGDKLEQSKSPIQIEIIRKTIEDNNG